MIAKVVLTKDGIPHRFYTSVKNLLKGKIVLVETAIGNQLGVFQTYMDADSDISYKSIITPVENIKEYFEIDGHIEHISNIEAAKINTQVHILNGRNAVIKPNLMSRETMEHIGFSDRDGYWKYSRDLISDEILETEYRFVCNVFKDGKRIDIKVINVKTGDSYDYQTAIEDSSNHDRMALITHIAVQKHMKHLVESCVIENYKLNDFI